MQEMRRAKAYVDGTFAPRVVFDLDEILFEKSQSLNGPLTNNDKERCSNILFSAFPSILPLLPNFLQISLGAASS